MYGRCGIVRSFAICCWSTTGAATLELACAAGPWRKSKLPLLASSSHSKFSEAMPSSARGECFISVHEFHTTKESKKVSQKRARLYIPQKLWSWFGFFRGHVHDAIHESDVFLCDLFALRFFSESVTHRHTTLKLELFELLLMKARGRGRENPCILEYRERHDASSKWVLFASILILPPPNDGPYIAWQPHMKRSNVEVRSSQACFLPAAERT